MAQSAKTHPFGEPLNILQFGEGNKVIVDKAALEQTFLHSEVKNRKIVAVSIIGAFRRGKSFFLDYCLRYLYATYPSIKNPNHNDLELELNDNGWIGSPEEPLIGFSWRSGSRRDTTGIVMWSDVFLHTIATTGEKIALVLIDTQGLFDNKTSPIDNSRIFALGSLISSVQILNLAQIVQEDQLQYLQFATEFANFAAQDSRGSAGKPFQNLLFLIRDWQSPEDFEFGTTGGANYLKEVLKVESEQKTELKSVRQFISSSFEKIECCLMPHPGKKVTGKDYGGQWKEMDEEFRDELVIIIEKLLRPENLVIKKINDKELSSEELKEYAESYIKLFQSENLVVPQSIYESTVDKQLNIVVSKCLDSYKENIVKNEALLDENNLQLFHDLVKTKTLLMFKEEKKMGNLEHEKKFKIQLAAQMEELYAEWSDRSSKGIAKIREEKKKVEAAISEKMRLQQEALDAVRITKEKQAELERQNELHLIETKKYEAEKKVYELRSEAETARAAKVEAEQIAEKKHQELLEQELKYAELERKYNRTVCTIQ